MKARGVTPCGICSSPLEVSWWLIPFARWMTCASRGDCTFRLHLLEHGEPDPIEYEQEPEDVWVCSLCEGKGQLVIGKDWATGALNLMDCPVCSTTGVMPGYREPVS